MKFIVLSIWLSIVRHINALHNASKTVTQLQNSVVYKPTNVVTTLLSENISEFSRYAAKTTVNRFSVLTSLSLENINATVVSQKHTSAPLSGPTLLLPTKSQPFIENYQTWFLHSLKTREEAIIKPSQTFSTVEKQKITLYDYFVTCQITSTSKHMISNRTVSPSTTLFHYKPTQVKTIPKIRTTTRSITTSAEEKPVLKFESFLGNITAIVYYQECSVNEGRCENGGICYVSLTLPPVKFCRCVGNFFGERCENEENKACKQILFGLALLSGISVIIAFATSCRLYVKSGHIKEAKKYCRSIEMDEHLKSKENLCPSPITSRHSRQSQVSRMSRASRASRVSENIHKTQLMRNPSLVNCAYENDDEILYPLDYANGYLNDDDVINDISVFSHYDQHPMHISRNASNSVNMGDRMNAYDRPFTDMVMEALNSSIAMKDNPVHDMNESLPREDHFNSKVTESEADSEKSSISSTQSQVEKNEHGGCDHENSSTEGRKRESSLPRECDHEGNLSVEGEHENISSKDLQNGKNQLPLVVQEIESTEEDMNKNLYHDNRELRKNNEKFLRSISPIDEDTTPENSEYMSQPFDISVKNLPRKSLNLSLYSNSINSMNSQGSSLARSRPGSDHPSYRQSRPARYLEIPVPYTVNNNQRRKSSFNPNKYSNRRRFSQAIPTRLSASVYNDVAYMPIREEPAYRRRSEIIYGTSSRRHGEFEMTYAKRKGIWARSLDNLDNNYK